MPLEVLFSDVTFTLGVLGKNEPINYAIVNEKHTAKIDVVVVRNVPTDERNMISIPDPEAGWTEAVKLRKKLTVLSGTVSPGNTSAIHVLDNPRIVREIDAEKIVTDVLGVAEKIASGEIEITNNIVHVDGLSFKILRFKPPTSREDFDTVMMYLYLLAAGKKRIMVSSPAFVEVMIGDKTYWCVTTIPRVLPYLWEAPGELAIGGLVEPGGFNAPFIIVRNVSWRDIADVRKSINAVKWVSILMSQVAGKGSGGGSSVAEEGEIEY